MWLEDLSMANNLYFYNGDTIVLRFQFNADKISFYEVGTGWVTLKSTIIGENGWLNITHIEGNQMNYSWYEEGGTTVYAENASYSSNDWTTFTRIYFYSNVSSNGMAMDDLILFYDTVLDDDCIDSTYSTYNIPEYAGLPTSLYNGQYVEHQYTSFTGIGLTGELTWVRLLISNDQYNLISSNPANYTLVVNGEDFGSADYIAPDGSNYYIQWNISKILGNSEPIFSFGCNKLLNYGYLYFYWFGLGVETSSIWGSKEHNTSSLHTNSLYDGDDYEPDIAYDFHMECIVEPIPPIDTNDTDDYYDVYFKFYDASRTENNLLYFKGLDVNDNVMGSLDYVECLIYSSLSTNGFRYSYSTTSSFTANLLFSEGDYMDFHFCADGYTNFNTRINNKIVKFSAVEKTYQLYPGQTFNVYLYPVGYIDGVNYINCGESYPNRKEDNKAKLCINKVIYDFGETIRLEYVLPDGKWLDDNGFNTNINNYAIKIYNTNDYVLLFGRRTKLHEAPRIYIYNIPTSHFDNTRHTYEIPIQEYNSYGFKDTYYKCEMVIDAIDLDWWKDNVLIDKLYFYISGQEFEPLGNITGITPNPCYSNQIVDISFTSNNVGWLEIREPDGNTVLFSQHFLYSDATHVIPWRCSWEGAGVLPVYLYTEGPDYNHIDTELLTVNSSDLNETFGWRGYGIPYLYIPERQGNYIAGNSTVYIHYRTYKNNSVIIIKSPRKEQTYYSTTVSNQSRNHLAIKLDNWMQLGTWNVTFYCGDIYGENITLYTEFNVVNEEGHWVEFTKHTYTTDEPFELYIKNTLYRISLTFYKNDVATGESIIYNANEPDYKILIPITNVKPEIGHWRVEMWRINDRNIVYELAEWECDVIKGVASDVIKQEFGVEIPDWAKLIIGFFLVLMMTIAPILMIVLINKKSRRAINLPVLVYVGFFYFGLAISILLGFIPIEIIFVILFGTILAFLVLFLTGNLNKVTGG